MTITWLGQSCFKIQNNDLILITDPYGPVSGLRPIKGKADIVTISHQHKDHNYLKEIMDEPFVISEPGEYEVKGVYILGIPSGHDSVEGDERGQNIIYRYFFGGMVLAHLGGLRHLFSEDTIDQLGDVDILFVPVGNKHTLATDKVAEPISQVEPRIVIPMHYQIPGLSYDLKPLSVFGSEMGVRIDAQLDRLKIKKKDFEAEETAIKVLKKQ